MDANRKQTFPALLAGCGLMFAAAINADADVRIHAYTDQHIHFSGDDVLITGQNDNEARITPDGGLSIAGRAVAVNEAERRLLMQYSEDAHGIARQGGRIGAEGAHMAVAILDDVFSNLWGGDVQHVVEERAKAHSAGLKASVRVLCDDMKSLQAVQAKLADSLASFQPYAVITDDYIDKCYGGINHDHDED